MDSSTSTTGNNRLSATSQLALRITEEALSYACYGPAAEESLQFGTIPLPGRFGRNSAKEVENVVYDTPLLLEPFKKTTVLAQAKHFAIIPDEFSENGKSDECRRYFSFLYPDDDGMLLLDRIEDDKATIAFSMQPDTVNFLNRTFSNPRICHILSPMVCYFRTKSRSGELHKMFAYFSGRTVEVIVLRDSRLAFANFFSFSTADDALYFILNAWQQCGMNPKTAELSLAGDKASRKAVLPALKKYIANVGQSIFPAKLLRWGRTALDAPFDLIVLPLCE